jgi:4-amino-4-deoxy-L-arabinose transferase-like glycosyltransferase
MEGPLISTRLLPAKGSQPTDHCAGTASSLLQSSHAHKRNWPIDLTLILTLILIAAGLRAWSIGHTAVAARDSIGFIRYALDLESQSWLDVFRNSQQHPGYPMVLLLVSWPVRYCFGGINPVSMQMSAQIASGLASILLVIPMYLLGRQFFDRRAGFWGSLLFQILPVSGRAMSDGLSEATFLFFVTLSLLIAVLALRKNSFAALAWAGMFGGFSYLTRPEGALVVLAAALVLIGKQGYKPWRASWLRVAGCVSTLCGGALLVGGPYALAIGSFTNKPTPRAILESRTLEGVGQEESLLQLPHEAPIAIPGMGARPVFASMLGLYAPGNLRDRRWWAVLAILTELIKGYQYLLALPVLIGMWWFRSLIWENAGTWVLLILCLLHTLILWKLAMTVGYVSDRHIVLLVLCGIFTGAAILGVWGDYLESKLFRTRANRGVVATLTLAAIALFCLPDSFRTLHANRAGHRAAGIWLASNAAPGDPIIDPFCWAHYYAGRIFTEGHGNRPNAVHPATQYVVLEQSDHARLPTIRYATDLASHGQIVYHWPVEKPEQQAKVRVYAVRSP